MNLMTPEEREQAVRLVLEGNRRFYLDPKNYYDFVNDVMSYGMPPEMNMIRPEPHQELCDFVTNWTKRIKLILLPRGSLKSTIVTQGYSIWRLLKNPNLRILIASENLNNAQKYAGVVKTQFESNAKLRDLFGDYTKQVGWTESEFTVSKRTLNLREPSVSTAGVEMTRVGQHYDLIIVDDPMSHNNTQNKEQIEKVIEWYKGLLSILDPNGQMIIIGTRWHDADLYGYLMDQENEAEKNTRGEIDVMVRKAIQDDGSLFFPDVLTQEFLDQQLRTQSAYFFSMQYQNDPIPTDTAVFKRDYFQYYETYNIKGRNFNTYVAVDPAISEAATSDYSAIVVVSIDEENNLYIRDIDRGHWKPSELINKIFYYDKLYEPRDVIIETVAFQKSLQYALKDEMKKRGYFIPLKEVNPGPTRGKELRIQALEPRYRNKTVFHPKASYRPLIPHLEDELLRFPRGKHDDLIDALAYTLETIRPSKPYKRKHIEKKDKEDEEENHKKMLKPRYKSTGY